MLSRLNFFHNSKPGLVVEIHQLAYVIYFPSKEKQIIDETMNLGHNVFRYPHGHFEFTVMC